MFRYIIIFLIGFFLGHAFSGNLGLLFQKTKELVTGVNEPRPAREYQVASSPPPQATPVKAVSEPAEQKKRTTYQAVERPPQKQVAGREQMYTIQVASFKTKNQAAKYVEQLVEQKYNAFIAPPQSDKPADWYRVCIGETISPDQAKALSAKLKPTFKDSFIYSY